MGMAAPRTDWTVERLHALPDDGNRYEIIGGELLVTPSPSALHQTVVLCLAARLKAYLDRTRAGALFIAPGDVLFDRHTLVQPDLFVTPLVNGRRPTSWAEAPRPVLHIEVVSPGSARHDRRDKRTLYQTRGIPEYWIVDPDARLVERWRPGEVRPEVITDRLEWRPDEAREPFEVALDGLWEEVFER